MSRARVVVLASGGGTNLQALIEAARMDDSAFEIVRVICNRPGASALGRAAAAGIDPVLIDHKGYSGREAFDAALAEAIEAAAADLVACAGFMRILTESFTRRFEGRLLNIHPSLLPLFKGLDTHARAIDAGVAFHGCTVHWVSAGVDEGAIIGQACLAVRPGDTPETLAARVLEREHALFPACLTLAATGRAVLKDGRNWLDGAPGALALPG
jgi:phosphoribosylglycinamide formyltransferase 1